jgi:uncharacterized membrane protein YphA (DoxX/SURF4 family)
LLQAPERFEAAKESCLQKLYSTFPSEWPGIGLLLLRALVGVSLIVQGVGYVQWPNPGVTGWGLAGLAFTGGAFLLAGFMTPFVASLVAAGGIGIVLAWIPLPGQTLFDSYLAIINLIVLSIAIALLGPGAFSLDARMFGRREISIPSSSHMSRP